MNTSLPVLALTTLGILIALLGLFAAGDIAVIALGLGAIAVGGVIGLAERRSVK